MEQNKDSRYWCPVLFPAVYVRHYSSRSPLSYAILMYIIGFSGECTLIPDNIEPVKSVRLSYKDMAKRTKCTVPSVGRAIRKLLKNKLITRTKDAIGYLYKPNMETLSKLVEEALNEQTT